MRYKFLLVFINLTLLSGCNTFGKQYVYSPQIVGEQPATITASAEIASADKAMLGSLPRRAVFARIMRINGDYVQAGLSSFSIPAQNAVYKLSSGLNTIEVEVNIRELPGPRINPLYVPLKLNVLPGNIYRLGVSESQFNDYGIWIEDSQKTRIASAQFGVKH